MPASRLEDLLRTMEPDLRRKFLRLIRQIRQRLDVGELARLLEAGREDEILRRIQAAFAVFGDDVNALFLASGQATAAFIAATMKTFFSFDQVNEGAVSAMQANRLRLIREFMEEQRNAVREALTEGIRRGLNPREQARFFRQSIGLTTRQMQAVNNFRRLLESGSAEALTRELRDRRFDATVRRSIRSGRPLTQDQIDEMTERYRERMLIYRSEVIARTEALRAVNEGNFNAFQQAYANGTLDPSMVFRTWNTALDERVRGSHRAMHGQERGPMEPFTSGDGYSLLYPGDPNAPGSETIQCRCVASTRIRAASLGNNLI